MSAELDFRELEDAFDGVSKEQAEQAMRRWYSWSQDELRQAGDRLGYEWSPVMMNMEPPFWNERTQRYEFLSQHFATVFFEYGAEPHEIRARRAEFLAFPWPEMENEEFGNTGKTFGEVFADTWPIVFFKETSHPGMEETRFLRKGRDRARDWLASQGGAA